MKYRFLQHSYPVLSYRLITLLTLSACSGNQSNFWRTDIDDGTDPADVEVTTITLTQDENTSSALFAQEIEGITDTSLYELSARSDEEADQFLIDDEGVLRFRDIFDFDHETQSDYQVTIRIKQGAGNRFFETEDITLTVTATIGNESQDYDVTITVKLVIILPPLINDLNENNAETGTQSRATIEGTLPVKADETATEFTAEELALYNTADTLAGTASAEIIYGYGGDDTITTGGGIDVVIGGTGDDTITLKGGDGSTREQIIYQIDTSHDVWRTPDGSDVIHNFNFHTLDSKDGSLDRLFFVDKSVVLIPDEDKAFDGDGSFLQALIEGGGGLRFEVADATLPEAIQVIDKILITFGADEDGDESNGTTLTLHLENDLDIVSSTLIRSALGTGLSVTADNYTAAEAIFEAAGNPFSWLDDDDLPADLTLI